MGGIRKERIENFCITDISGFMSVGFTVMLYTLRLYIVHRFFRIHQILYNERAKTFI